MKIKFTIKERLLLNEIIPISGGIAKMILIRELNNKLILTGEDIFAVDMKDNLDGTTSWDSSKDPNKEIELSDAEINLLKESAKEFDKQEKITLNNLALIEKIMNM